MFRTFAAVILGATAIFVIAQSTGYAKPERASLLITVQIQNTAGIQASTLFDSRADVTRLYRQVGVQLSWVSVNPELVVILRSDTDACAMGASRETMGQAVINKSSRIGRVAYIYYDRIENLAEAVDVEATAILSHVMAHEMAHLLGVPHADRGLMRAGWDETELMLASRGLLRFSAAQGDVMHTGVAALANAALANQ